MLCPSDTALRVVKESHQYFVGERELVPVTRVLEIEGLIDPSWFTEESRVRGAFVHQACELDDAGTLDDDTLDERLTPYVDAYRLFKQEMSITGFDHVETPLADLILGIAGTFDRLSHLDCARVSVWDLKSGQDEPAHAFQTALYALLAEHNGLIPSARRASRACVHLGKNGRYKIEWHEDASDLRFAKAAAEVAVYKVTHGYAPMRRAG